MKTKWPHLLAWLAMLAAGCAGEPVQQEVRQLLYIGHAYDHHAEGRRVDPRLESLDLSPFHTVILGGDVCAEAMQEYSTLAYIDSLFDLGSPRTHYTLGNHDARNENHTWLHQFTGRPTFYTTSEQGLVTIVLNTTLNPGDCELLDAQYAMLRAVCDTITEASHLLLLHHHAIALDVPGIPHPWDMANWPYIHWDANCHDADPSYMAAIYPLLLRVKARGIEVVDVSGDTGFRRKKVEAVSEDGIHYLGSGIDNSRYARDPAALDSVPPDLVLIFEHQPAKRRLTWAFRDLDSLLAAQKR